MTPEGKVKKKVRDLLAQYPHCHYTMPVPGGYGKSSLDFVGCIDGAYFEIETKTDGKAPSDRQASIMNKILAAGGAVFVVTGGDQYGYMQLKKFLDSHSHGATVVPRNKQG